MKLATYDDLGFLALWACERTPLRPLAAPLGRALGDIDRLVRAGRRRRVERNVRRFDPEMDDGAVKRLVEQIFRDRWSGRGISLYREWARRAARGDAEPRTPVEGWERLEAALAAGEGVVLWEAPFGSRSRLHISLLERGVEFLQVHGAEHGGSGSRLGQNVVKGMNRRAEEAVVPNIVDIQEGGYAYLRKVKARIADGGVVLMPGLGPKGRRFVRLDFLGFQESFATGVVSLAMSTGAALIPAYSFLEAPGRPKTVFEEPVRFDASRGRDEAQVEAVTQYARLLESYVRRFPTQWRRWHAEPLETGKESLPAVSVDRTSGGGVAGG